MPTPPKPPKDIQVDLNGTYFSPEGDETRTVGGEAVDGFVREGNDIPKKAKQSLAKFLAKQTVVNAYPVDGATYREVASNTATGAPVFERNPPAGQHVFVDPKELDTGNNTNAEALTWVQENLSKGRTDNPKEFDGHSLLGSVTGDAPSGEGKFSSPESDDKLTTGYVSKVLTNNRFTPKRPVGVNTPPIKYQNKFGVYDTNAPEISQETLSKIGPLLTLRAAGELGAEDRGFDPPDAMNVRTILPGKSQLGISRIDTVMLEARSALTDIAGGLDDLGRLESDFDLNSLSFGQINTYADPFSGLLPAGMSALAIALILAAQIAIDLFASLMNMISTASSTSSQGRDSLGRYLPGKSYTNPGQERGSLSVPLPARLFGIERTEHVYADAVSKGLEIFFDIGLGRTIVEPGFFVTLLRSILSSAALLVRKVTDIFGSGNPFKVLNAVLGFVDAIRSSKIVAAMNVFAHIGDTALKLEETFPDGADMTRLSAIDELPSGLPGSAIVKSRDRGSHRLAWRNSTAPMTILMPTAIQNAGATKNLNRKLSSMNRTYAGQKTMYMAGGASENRIPLENMKKIEAALEAEYVPFYFHDMRTNEIIAFHAFLNNLADSYTVNHETIEAYGRVEPVKIYKSTQRTLQLSFTVVSTDEDDFDMMWMKINKVLTLLYPQWSAGITKHTPSGDRFVQPFSQVPAASPVFRLRVGDVVKSNYSRFALKRIFGYGSSEFKSGKVDDASLGALNSADKKPAHKPHDGTVSETDSLRINEYYMLRPAPSEGYLPAGAGKPGLSIGKTIEKRLRNRSNERVQVKKIESDGRVRIDISGEAYLCTTADLIELRDDSRAAAKKSAADKSSSHTLEGTGGFFDPGSNVGQGPDAKANTIVRSFESAMSKGLMCVINSANFNWLESTTWETELFGGKAPKVAKIDLNLSTFHDIAPGLDANGFNRAPVYNVGQYANQLGDDDPEGEKNFEFYRNILWGSKSSS